MPSESTRAGNLAACNIISASSAHTRGQTVAGMRRQHARQPDRLQRHIVADQLIAGGGGVAFVEHQVERVDDRIEPLGELVRFGHAEADVLVAQQPFRAHQALRDGALLRRETRARSRRR